MAYIRYSNNPYQKVVGDCVVRALSVACDTSWDETYWGLCKLGFEYGDMPSSNAVWGEYLKRRGFRRYVIPDTCPDCYTVRDFANDHPVGTYVVGTGTHAVCVKGGNAIDAWDSRNEVPVYYFKKER